MQQTAVITGAASGIGRATAQRFHEDGYAIAVLDQQEEPREGGTPTHELIQDDGGDAIHIKTDVTDRESVRDAMETVVDRFGDIDVLVNNAGIAETASIQETDPETWDRIMAVNLDGVFHCTQLALPHLAANASIVNVASVAGKHGSEGLSAYCASKAGVIRFTDAVARELDGITVNAVCPRRTKTAMTGFEGDPPSDVAETIHAVSRSDRDGAAVDVHQ